MADIDNDQLELNELQSMANGLEQEQQPPPNDGQQQTVNPELQAYGMARAFLEIAARGAQMRWPCLSYNDDVKNEGAAVLVPVIIKYNVQNEFFAKYQEEFAAGAFFAGVIFTSYQKVKAYEAEQKARAQAEQAARETQPEAA